MPIEGSEVPVRYRSFAITDEMMQEVRRSNGAGFLYAFMRSEGFEFWRRIRRTYIESQRLTHFEQLVRPCCERDTDGDGNCHVHVRSGVLRSVRETSDWRARPIFLPEDYPVPAGLMPTDVTQEMVDAWRKGLP